jgi:anti-sigma-K factor RskA
VTERAVLDHEAVRDLAGLYALGALAPDEAAAVRQHVATCALEHAEIDEAGAVVGALLQTVEPAEPSAALKGRLMAAAESDLREGRHPSTAGAGPGADVPPVPIAPRPAAATVPTTAPKVVSLDTERSRRSFRWVSLAAAAGLILAVGLGAWNVALRGQLADAEAYRQGVQAALVLASEPGSSTALLASEDGSVSGLGVVGADGTVLLAMRGLAPTSGGEVYAAWSIGADGVPVNIGEFKAEADGTATARASGAAAGDVLALTLEPGAGATAPTLPIVASGTAEPVAG